MNNTIKLVQDWAKERGIDKADPSKQLLKLGEEYGELIADFIKGYNESMRLEIGDMLVVLTIFCQQMGVDLEECFNDAYEKIKRRQGKNVNGVFVKDECVGVSFVKDEYVSDGNQWQR